MKKGKSLVELATEVQRQSESKKDYIAPAGQLRVVLGDGNAAKMAMGPSSPHFPDGVIPMRSPSFDIAPVAHGQLAEYTGIPKAYYDRMMIEKPELFAENVNQWLVEMGKAKSGNKRLVRTLDGRVRAFLSDSYRPLDNFDLAEAVLPVLADKQLKIVSCEITERRLYIKAFNSEIAREIEMRGGDVFKKDVCSPVICISNSEVGFGALSITAGIFTEGCTNLAFFSDSSMRKYHVGKASGASDEIQALLSDKTKRLTDAAIWAQVGDVVNSAFDVKRFETLIGRVQETAGQPIEGDVVKVVNLTCEKLGFTKAESGGVLKHLIQGGDLSRYGMFNAVTRMAEDVEDYDRASEFERAGGKVIELPRSEWEVLAKAA